MPYGLLRHGSMEMISEQDLENFRTIYKEVFSEEIGKEEALEKAQRLLNLYKAVYLNNPNQPNKT